MNTTDLNSLNDKIISILNEIKLFIFTALGYEDKLNLDPTYTSQDNKARASDNYLSSIGINTSKDSDGDGVPNINDVAPYDPNNFTDPKIMELFSSQLSIYDRLRVSLGFSPLDRDMDGIPDSVEEGYKTNTNSPDTDSDGIYDGEEIYKGLNPINADTDNDGVIDGRDAFPMDKYKSIYESDIDTDGDGVGDRFELMLSMDSSLPDTDNDGLRDGIDPSPLMHENNSNHIDVGSLTEGLHLAIQNNLLSFLADLLTVLTLLTLPLAIFVFFRWFWEIRSAIDHYYHIFHDAYGYKEAYGHASHDYLNDIKTHKDEHKTESSHIAHSAHTNDQKVNSDSSDINFTNSANNVVEGSSLQDSLTGLASERKENEKWKTIVSYMSEPGEVFWRMAIIEADAMLTTYLDERSGLGVTFAEKLDGLHLGNLDDIWQAHRTRNRIAHEGASYRLTEREARIAYNAYENVFLKLGII